MLPRKREVGEEELCFLVLYYNSMLTIFWLTASCFLSDGSEHEHHRAEHELYTMLLSAFPNESGSDSHSVHRLDVSELAWYLKLFVVDESVSFSCLVRMRIEDRDLFHFHLASNVSERAHRIKHRIMNSKQNTDLKRKLDESMNRDSMRKVSVEWTAIKRLIIKECDRMNLENLMDLWLDLMAMIKKDVLKLLMNDSNNGYGVEFFYNDDWIIFIANMLSVIGDVTVSPSQQTLVHSLVQHIHRFEVHLIAFYKDIKLRFGYILKPRDTQNREESVLMAFYKHKRERIDVLLDGVNRRNQEIGILNEAFLDSVHNLFNLRCDVIRECGENTNFMEPLQILKYKIMTALYRPHIE